MIKFNNRNEGKDSFVTFLFSNNSKFNYRDFKTDNIQVRCKNHWYLNNIENNLERIIVQIEKAKQNKFLFVGSSKGAFASILYSALLSQKFPEKEFRVLAFAPVTYLKDYGCHYFCESSPMLGKYVKKDKGINERLKKYGDLAKLLDEHEYKNLKIMNMYSFDDKQLTDVYYVKHIQVFPFVSNHYVDSKYLKDKGCKNYHTLIMTIYRKDRDLFYNLVEKAINI